MQQGRFRFIVLVMLEPLPIANLPDEMRTYVQTNTYIDATQELQVRVQGRAGRGGVRALGGGGCHKIY